LFKTTFKTRFKRFLLFLFIKTDLYYRDWDNARLAALVDPVAITSEQNI